MPAPRLPAPDRSPCAAAARGEPGRGEASSRSCEPPRARARAAQTSRRCRPAAGGPSPLLFFSGPRAARGGLAPLPAPCPSPSHPPPMRALVYNAESAPCHPSHPSLGPHPPVDSLLSSPRPPLFPASPSSLLLLFFPSLLQSFFPLLPSPSISPSPSPYLPPPRCLPRPARSCKRTQWRR